MAKKKRPVISVTQSNINVGEERSIDSCPIALAVRRRFRLRASDVSVDRRNIRIAKSGVETPYRNVDAHWCRYKTPKAAADFVGTFDHDGRTAVKPFKFTLPKAMT